LIFLPAVLILRRSHIPLREGLRLNPILSLTALCVFILGIALYLFGLLIEWIMSLLTGLESVAIPSNLLPKTPWDIVFFAVALANFCNRWVKRTLFRGVIQGAYEKHHSAKYAASCSPH